MARSDKNMLFRNKRYDFGNNGMLLARPLWIFFSISVIKEVWVMKQTLHALLDGIAVSSIIYEGIRGVFILLFSFMAKFYMQKEHKMQTSEIKHLLFRHLKNLEKKLLIFFCLLIKALQSLFFYAFYE